MVAVLETPRTRTRQSRPICPFPLENGDHLTRTEFERRYDAMPNLRKAELIEGVVQMPSPIRIEHMEADLAVITWLGVYVALTPGVRGGGDGSVRLDADNEVQPDALLRIEEACGGQSRVAADGFIEGAPELVVEISGSSASYDLHAKLNIYRRAGVREYVVWRVYDDAIDWFVQDEGRFVAQAPDEQGVYASRVFPGLRLPVQALLDGKLADVLASVQQGAQTQEHADFVKKLKSQGTAA
ncbi:MAG: Uma2 family endonuclease [Caldilineaceae bacterium]|nr:Uma2 family endonuclease [Caldilineaceae bacterium]